MKTHEPLVSVIVPTYNRATIVPRALRSILGQTYQNLEILLVDDASTDNTREVVAAMADPRIRYLRHEHNRGGSVARNTGIKAASGEYLAFLDSDDEWLPDKLRIQVDAMRKQGALFSYCQSICEEKGVEIHYPKRAFAGGSLLKYLVGDPDGAMSTPSFMLQRSVRVYFDEALSVFQDWDFVLQIHRQTQELLFVPVPLCRIHYDAPNRTRQRRGRLFIERAQPFLGKYAAELEACPDVQRFLVWGCAVDAQAHGNPKLARAILLQYRLFPSLRRKPHAITVWLKSFWAV